MNKEFYKMQKTAGLITESEYKEKTGEIEDNLNNILTANGLHTFLHDLRNLINDKEDVLPMINNAISSIADELNENDSIKLSYKDKQLIKKFQNWAVDNPTSTDVEFFSSRHNLNSEQRSLLKRVFLSDDFKITPTGPLPSDIKPRIGN
jgi:hypothetical protein